MRILERLLHYSILLEDALFWRMAKLWILGFYFTQSLGVALGVPKLCFKLLDLKKSRISKQS